MSEERPAAASPHHVRLARDSDHDAIMKLLGELLPELDTGDHWRWIYRDNPHGRAITWVAIDDATGDVAGCTSFFRRRMWVKGREVMAAMGGDGWVTPRYRRRGIAGSMHRQSRQDMRAHGVEMMFGTPMPANGTPLSKAGARDVTVAARYVRPLDAKALRLPGKLGEAVAPLLGARPTRTRLEPMVPNDKRLDEVWAMTRGELPIATIRDAEFFMWRYFTAPSRVQTAFVCMRGNDPVGACAVEFVGARRMRIVDLLAPREHWASCLRAIVGFARGLGSVELKVTPRQAKDYRLWSLGFFARDEKPINVLLPPGDPEASTYFDPNAWTFSWADSDVDKTI